MSGDRLASQLLEIGRQAGLDACGVCSAEPFEEARRALEDGRCSGRSAEMQFTYRNPARSSDPARSLEGAQALFVGAKAYARRPRSEGRHSRNTARPAGSVAMYSWTDHYRVLRDALGQVAGHLESEGWQAKVLVDDNALVDRAAAVRAGLGWYGKNTNVLLPRLGSTFVLGSVVTDAPIDVAQPRPSEADRPLTMTIGPVPDGCGTCRRCVDACPTSALDGEGHLDARRCLAWLLQAPGTFPRELRIAAGDRIYGCDDCQDACPVNRTALKRDPPPAAEDTSLEEVDLLEMLAADDRALMDRYGRWYIPKRDPNCLRRNALIALGNTADPGSRDVGDAVASALVHPSSLVRAHAVWAASRLGRSDLLTAVVGDSDPDVRDELAAAGTVPVRAGAQAT